MEYIHKFLANNDKEFILDCKTYVERKYRHIPIIRLCIIPIMDYLPLINDLQKIVIEYAVEETNICIKFFRLKSGLKFIFENYAFYMPDDNPELIICDLDTNIGFCELQCSLKNLSTKITIYDHEKYKEMTYAYTWIYNLITSPSVCAKDHTYT